MGRRIFKKVYNGEILEKHLSFVYDGYKLIEERNALDNNAAVRKYVWQPEALDRDVPLTVYDVASEKTYYYHTDANKNVTELSEESGNVVAHYEYSPFGSLTKVTGDYAGNNPFRFSSEYFDEETGLVYYNYRYYNPELGRWISRDPIEEQGGYNLYGMIKNNPLLGWDNLGQNKFHDWCKIIIFIIGLAGGDPGAGDPDPPPPPPPPKVTTTVNGPAPKDKKDPKFEPLPWWARGGRVVDNIITTTAEGAKYVAAGALGAAAIIYTGGSATPVVIKSLGKMIPAFGF